MDLNFQEATEIQSKVYVAAQSETDLLIISPTGTGKTESYVLPILNKIANKTANKNLQVLVITPTRELVLQTTERIQKLSKGTEINTIAIYGGQAYDATQEELNQDPKIAVASLGRLLDLIDKGWISLKDVELLVIDEVDEILAMGFAQSLQLLLTNLHPTCKKWMISATINHETQKLANKILSRPIEIKSASTQNIIDEQVLFVSKQDKKELISYLITSKNFDQVIVFTRTTHAVDRIEKYLSSRGIKSAALYGDKKQSERESALKKLINKEIQVLVATDIATRGIDIPSLQAIINYEVPDLVETYIHRIGRSARGLATGVAYTFCDHEDNAKLIQLQHNLKKVLPVDENHPLMANWQKELLTYPSRSKKKRK